MQDDDLKGFGHDDDDAVLDVDPADVSVPGVVGEDDDDPTVSLDKLADDEDADVGEEDRFDDVDDF